MQITLKAARVNQNLTQAEAAEIIGVSLDTIKNWEQYKSYPNVTHINKIEEAYHLSYNDINFLPADNS